MCVLRIVDTINIPFPEFSSSTKLTSFKIYFYLPLDIIFSADSTEALSNRLLIAILTYFYLGV